MSESDLSEEKGNVEESSEDQGQAVPQEGEPAPTDYRRNFWLLVIIVAVVVSAWVLAILWKRQPRVQLEQEAPEPPAAQRPIAPARPARARVVRAGPVPVSRVLGSDAEMIEASPAQALPGTGITYRKARFFDVTQRVPDLELDMLVRVPGWTADQRQVLRVADMPEPPFQPAAEVTGLVPTERVVVVRGESQVKAYPVRVFLELAGVRDELDGQTVFVCWSSFTQAGRCLVAQVEGADVDWQDAGLLFRGNNVYYDAGAGSLWDPLSATALTGSMAGRKANVRPIAVWRWEDWRAANPAAQVLAAGMEQSGGLVAAARVEPYLEDPALPAEVKQFDPAVSPLPAKAFVLGVTVGDRARAYPLAELAAQGAESVTDALAGQEYAVHVTSPRTAYATAAGRLLDAPVMLWFAWLQAHPDSEVYEVAGQTPPGPAQSQ